MDAKLKAESNSDVLTPLQPRLFPGRSQGQVLTLTRFLNAPPARVFQLWTEPLHVGQWFAPTGFTVVRCEIALRAKGHSQLVLRGADGTEFTISREFLLVDAPKRLVFNEHCVGSSGVFYEALTTVSFEKLGNKTKLTLRAEPHQQYRSDEQDEWRKGCNELLDRLEQYVSHPL